MMLRIEVGPQFWPLSTISPATFADTLLHHDCPLTWTTAQTEHIHTLQAKLTGGEFLTYADLESLDIAVRALSTAEGVAERARHFFRTRAAEEVAAMNSDDPCRLWTNRDAQRRYINAHYSAVVAVVNDSEVVASIPKRYDNDELAHTALDYATQDLPDSRLGSHITESGHSTAVATF